MLSFQVWRLNTIKFLQFLVIKSQNPNADSDPHWPEEFQIRNFRITYSTPVGQLIWDPPDPEHTLLLAKKIVYDLFLYVYRKIRYVSGSEINNFHPGSPLAFNFMTHNSLRF